MSASERNSSRQPQHANKPGPEHTTLGLNHSSGSECNSSRHSYAGAYADDKDSVKGEMNSFHTHGLPHKPAMRHSPGTQSTSDLASTVGTDMLTNHSQDITYHTKAWEDIYARNAELLVNTGSQESIHMFGSEGGGDDMFGSEGGGEADGWGDIDDMLFAKYNDLEDDSSSTMAEDETDEPYLSEWKAMTRLKDPRSSSNLDIPPDPYNYRERKGWMPSYNWNHSHYMEHIPSSVSTLSNDGTVKPQRALAGYDQNSLSSSSTSFASTYFPLTQQVSFLLIIGVHDTMQLCLLIKCKYW